MLTNEIEEKQKGRKNIYKRVDILEDTATVETAASAYNINKITILVRLWEGKLITKDYDCEQKV